MSACTFFGHRDSPATIKPRLRSAIIDLIENYDVDTFYVGNQGFFDAYARSILKELVDMYPHIRYAVVLAYMPQPNDEFDCRDYSDTMIPAGIEKVPKRFAINWRNKWMLDRCVYVISYVNRSWGGAAKFTELATKDNKTIVSL